MQINIILLNLERLKFGAKLFVLNDSIEDVENVVNNNLTMKI